MYGKWIGLNSLDVEALICSHLVKIELKTKRSLELDGEVTEDEEGAILVVRVLKSVERRDQSTSQCRA
jgi:hypothetical protein